MFFSGIENAADIAKDAASPDGSGEPVVPAPAPKTTLSANAPMFVPKIYQQPRNQVRNWDWISMVIFNI